MIINRDINRPAVTAAYSVIICGIIFQALLVSYTFPIAEVLTTTPLAYVDNAYHWYALSMSKHLFAQDSSIIYDPHFNAGIPFAFSTDPSANPAKLIYVILQKSITEIQAWKIYVFVAALVGPIFPGLGLTMLGFRPAQILLGLVLSLFVWWISWFHYFQTHGMVSWVLGCFSAFFVICLVLVYRDEPSLKSTVYAGCSGAMMILIHPLSVIPVFFLLSTYLICNTATLFNWRFMLFLSGFAALSVGLNFWWLADTFSPVFSQGLTLVSYQAYVYPQNIVLELLGMWGKHVHGARVYPLLFLLSILAVFRSTPEQRKLWIFPFILAWAAIQVYASVAGVNPLLAILTQPNRHAPAGYLLLIVPATMALPSLMANTGDSTPIMFKRGLQAAYFLSALNFLFCGYEFIREVTYGKHGRYASAPPRVKPLGEYSDFVLSSLEGQTTTSARVLFETSKGRIHDRGHMAGYYAYTSGREFIGGPYTFRYFAGFWDGYVFGRPIGEIPRGEFLDYLDLYNIGWVLAHFEESKNYFDGFDEFRLLGSYKELSFYSVDRAHSFFIKGTGAIKTRETNGIELTGLQGSQIILKYHYIPGLSSSPVADIEPVFVKDDPLPFIQINNPPPELTIYLKH